VDAVAAAGFAAAADAYQEARPSWPEAAVDAAIDHWRLDPARDLVVDLAAGTGRLTSILSRRCHRLVAVEPVPEMRAYIDGVEAVAGTAEDLPLADDEVAGVFVAEAFHWFDYPAALAELARVLREGGGLGIMWHTPLPDDRQSELRAAIAALIAPYAYHPKGLNFLERDARDDLAWQREPAWAAFEPLVHHEFEHEQDTTRAGLVRLVASWAFIARLDEDTRADILRRADQLARDHGVERYRQGWRTDLYLTRRR